jgi:hypothetical protein
METKDKRDPVDPIQSTKYTLKFLPVMSE